MTSLPMTTSRCAFDHLAVCSSSSSVVYYSTTSFSTSFFSFRPRLLFHSSRQVDLLRTSWAGNNLPERKGVRNSCGQSRDGTKQHTRQDFVENQQEKMTTTTTICIRRNLGRMMSKNKPYNRRRQENVNQCHQSKEREKDSTCRSGSCRFSLTRGWSNEIASACTSVHTHTSDTIFINRDLCLFFLSFVLSFSVMSPSTKLDLTKGDVQTSSL